MNLAGLTKRIEAIEQRSADKSLARKVVCRVVEEAKSVGGYDGPITPDMLVIERVIIGPPAKRPSDFDTLETWERYLAELMKLPEETPMRFTSIADAKDMIERKRRG
jgi:hypothetical protein